MSGEEREFCTAHSDKLDTMLKIQEQHGVNIEWLMRLGRNTAVVMGAILTIMVTGGLPVVWNFYRDHDRMTARIEAGEKSDQEIRAWKDHLAERAKQDHRQCHEK